MKVSLGLVLILLFSSYNSNAQIGEQPNKNSLNLDSIIPLYIKFQNDTFYHYYGDWSYVDIQAKNHFFMRDTNFLKAHYYLHCDSNDKNNFDLYAEIENGKFNGKKIVKYINKLDSGYIAKYSTEYSYINGILNGPYMQYRDGKLISQSIYRNNRLYGDMYYYEYDGNILKLITILKKRRVVRINF